MASLHPFSDHTRRAAAGDFFKVPKQVRILPLSLPFCAQWHISSPPLPTAVAVATTAAPETEGATDLTCSYPAPVRFIWDSGAKSRYEEGVLTTSC